MINILDISYKPSLEECSKLIQDTLFDSLIKHLESEYKALHKVEYSKDSLFKGWNIKFRKGGKALCTLYPNRGFFKLLIVVSKTEKRIVEEKLPTFSVKTQTHYEQTKEGMGQRWLMMEMNKEIYEDVLKLIQICYETR